MKKLFALIIAIAMVASLSLVSFAANTATNDGGTTSDTITGNSFTTSLAKTDVSFTAADPSYTVTVPATLTVGTSGNATIEGTSLKAVTVAAPAKVNMTYSGITIEANITVDALVLPALTATSCIVAAAPITQAVSVAWTTAPVVGTWAGSFVYTVTTAA